MAKMAKQIIALEITFPTDGSVDPPESWDFAALMDCAWEDVKLHEVGKIEFLEEEVGGF